MVKYFSKLSCVLVVGLMSGTGIATVASAAEYQNALAQNTSHHVRAIGVTNNSTLPNPDSRRQTIYSVFTPKPQTSNAKLDYTFWSEMLNEAVIDMGPSLRSRAVPGLARIYSRIKIRKSAYRLEGSRIIFSYMSDEYVDALTAYRKDLVSIANERDMQTYSKKEQLAFWMNLHNVLLIETIAKEYPVRKPARLKIGANGETLHEAKLVTIQGVPLSLRDIRENIVYSNWADPIVIYGFFRGDIGGPGIQDYAVTGDNISNALNLQAVEFVNSLRGFNAMFNSRSVSRIYQEAAPYYFKNWPRDLETHLRQYAKGKTLNDIGKDAPFKVAKYEEIVTDLWGGIAAQGSGQGTAYDPSTNSQITGLRLKIPPLMYERAGKLKILRKKGMLDNRNSVTITDVETIDEQHSFENQNSKLRGNSDD